MFKLVFASVIILIFSQTASAQKLQGRVLDEKDHPVDFVSISIQGTNTNTITNGEGDFELILPGRKGNNVIVSHIGYITDTLKNAENIKEKITIRLRPTYYTVSDIIVPAHSLAERLILNTIANKSSYLQKLGSYSSLNYNRLYFKNELKKDSNITIYENVSKHTHTFPDKDIEEILTVRTGVKALPVEINPNIFGIVPNVYSDNIELNLISCISPLNKNALDYFSFSIRDTNIADNKRVYSINFSPLYQDRTIPKGYIDIVDSIYQVAYVYVEIPQAPFNQQMSFNLPVKRTDLTQTFKKYQDSIWLPITNLIESSVFNRKGTEKVKPARMSLAQLTMMNNYIINNDREVKERTGDADPVINSIKPSNSVYWDSVQAIPLTKYERSMMHRIDSIYSSSFVFKMVDLFSFLSGGPFSSFNDYYHFNRVEGSYLGLGLDSRKYLEPFYLKGKFGYGTADKRSKYSFEAKWRINNNLSLYAGFKNDISFLNRFYDYSQFDITFSAAAYQNDYADYYYSRRMKYGLKVFPLNNISLDIAFNRESFTNAKQNTSWSLFSGSGYRSVTEVMERTTDYFEISLKFDNSRYIDLFFNRYKDSRHDYLTLEVNTLLSPKKILNSDIDYYQLFAKLDFSRKFSRLTDINLIAQYGFSNSNVPQFNLHLPGNFAALRDEANVYRSIYQDNYWGEKMLNVFLQNNFSNYPLAFITKDINIEFILFGSLSWMENSRETPIIKLSKFSQAPIAEIGAGLNNLFLNGFRIDFSYRLDKRDPEDERLGFSLSFEY